ncbi:hypothetical protein BCR35DRAFT_350363 [Leucosporidium creatinivorum]|uniref:Uncharacterized protein n=1 Tax=Leucosporidium creatinivorum TaxID=106004 RepID=A0A1Y2FZ63_9BASI|nr:hypothetical protein BCR35DRAFT_350363 [Leucosporidium creatinivorum]
MARGAKKAEPAVVPSSQQDELADDPQFAPQLNLPPPKLKRQRTKSTSSNSTKSKVKETADVPQKRKPTPKVTKPSVASSSSKLERPQQPSSDSSSSNLDRFRYKQRPPALEEKDSNAPYKPPRKKSRSNDQKRADRDGDETSEATMSKQAGKRPGREEIVFTMPELDEDGEPIMPSSPAQAASVPIAEAYDEATASSTPSNSSIDLPRGMQTRLRRDSADSPSSPRASPAKLTANAPASSNTFSDTVRAHKSSPTTPKVPRTAEDEQEIARCLEELQGEDFDVMGFEEDLVQEEKADKVTSDPQPMSSRPTSSAPMDVDEAHGTAPELEAGDEDEQMPPSPLASPEPNALEDDAHAPVPPRLNPQAFDHIMEGKEPSTSSSQLQSDANHPNSTPSLAQAHPRRSTAAAPRPPPQDLFAALAANPSPPRPRPTHRLVPLTTAGLSSHLEALVSAHIAEAASCKSRVSSLEKSLKARDEEIGALSAGLKQVKGEREELEREVESGRKEVEGWKGKVDLLREVRRGLLSELRERDERIAELEREKEERERGKRGGEDGNEASAEDDSTRQDPPIVAPPAFVEDTERQQEDPLTSDTNTSDANTEQEQVEQVEPKESEEGAATSEVEKDDEVPRDLDAAAADERTEAVARAEDEEGTK